MCQLYFFDINNDVKKFNSYFLKLLKENEKSLYGYIGNCVDAEDAHDVLEIVQQDDFEYPEETYYHNPELKISPKLFFKLTGKEPKTDHFYGFNKEMGIVFDYDPEKDIHYFYSK